jgi:hypothetical protein
MTLRVNTRSRKIQAALQKKQQQLSTIPSLAYRFFVSVTPRRSGNARRRTRLQSDIINADYPYAQRLNRGWSRQAPKGMTQPLVQYLRKLVRQIMGRK